MICLDAMGPDGAKRFPGRQLVRVTPGVCRARARQEVDDSRRGSGYVFGAFVPVSGEAFTATYQGRTIAHWLDFLDQADAGIAAGSERVQAILDNRSTHRALAVLRWALAHPHWACVFQPTHAAYLNLIEPWWKILRSLARKGRRFANWDEVNRAVAAATAYWNAHRHPFRWGQRRSRRGSRPSGVARLPLVA